MKRLLLVLLLLFGLISSAYSISLIGSGIATGGSPDYILLWDGDTCTGNDRRDAKGTGGACGDETGTLTTATIINTAEANYYVDFDAADEKFVFDLTGSFDEDELYLKMIVKLDASTANNNLFEWRTDGDNQAEVYLNLNGRLSIAYEATNNANVNHGDDDSIEYAVDGYYCVIEVKVSASNDVLAIRVCSNAASDCLVCGGAEPWDTTIDTGGPGIEAWTGTDPTVTFGEDVMGAITDGYHLTELELRTYANAP